MTAVNCGHSKTCVVACALGGPMKTAASPSVDRQRLHRSDRAEALGIVERHALRTLEVHEVAEGALPEGDQRDLDIRRIPA